MTGVWPVHIRRCYHCRKLIWPWQDVGRYDPEGMPFRHHECYHRDAQELWADEPDHDWRDYLWCGCPEARRAL